MNTATLTTPTTTPAAVSSATTLRRAIAGEVTRLTSIRSTWWSLLAATAMLVLLAIAFGTDTNGDLPITTPGEAGLLFGQFALYVPVVLGVTSGYTTGAIGTTLQGVPRRGVLLAARWVVLVLATTITAVLLALLADGVAAMVLGGLAGADLASITQSVGTIAAVVALSSTIAFGLSFALRSAAGVITSMFLLMIVLPLLLPVFGIDALTTIGEHTPGKAMFSLLDAFDDGTSLSPLRAWSVHGAWAGAAVATGAAALLRRDAA